MEIGALLSVSRGLQAKRVMLLRSYQAVFFCEDMSVAGSLAGEMLEAVRPFRLLLENGRQLPERTGDGMCWG